MVRALLLALVMTAPAMAQEWHVLRDRAFGYSVPIPPGYELAMRPEAGNSRIFQNAGGGILAVWGERLDGHGFASLVRNRQKQDERGGWDITYERTTGDWASYSAVQGNQIRYVRAIRSCGDGVAFFLIDYSRSEKKRYDPIVTGMVRGMKASPRC